MEFTRAATVQIVLFGLGASLATVIPADAAPGSAASASTTSADFNGDGIDDLAVGVPFEDVRGVADAGAVNVVYGSRGKGLRAKNDQFLHQDVRGVKGKGNAGDSFGQAVAGGDLNNDGFDDLAVGVFDRVSGVPGAGAVAVFYGSARGLRISGNQRWHQDVAGIPGTPELNDGFGFTLTIGDFGGNRSADLAIGVSGEDVPGANNSGVVHVLYGSRRTGLRAGAEQWSQDSPGVGDVAEEIDKFGFSLAAGDFDGNGRDDLAVGSVEESVAVAGDEAGMVHVLYSSTTGLTSTGSQVWDQGSPDVEDDPEVDDSFGSSLAAGDLGYGPEDDLVVGIPFESFPGESFVGAVAVLYGTGTGLAAANDQFWHQDVADVESDGEGAELWGNTVAVGNFGRGRNADLAVAGSSEDVGAAFAAGAVSVLYGSATGVTAVDDQFWHEDVPGIAGIAESSDAFGAALAVGNYGNGGQDDLVAGVPGEDIGTGPVENAGSVAVLYGTSTGIATTNNKVWHQNRAGIADACERFDAFGSAVS